MPLLASCRNASGGDVALLEVLTMRCTGVVVVVGVVAVVGVALPAVVACARATMLLAAGSGMIDMEGTLLRKLATAAAVAASASR